MIDVVVQEHYEKLSEYAARTVGEQIQSDPHSTLGLATGQTPLLFYEKLVERHREGVLDFEFVSTFNLDEYYPIGPDHPDSFHYYMETNFFRHVNVREENRHIPDGTVTSVEAECDRYEKAIREHGGIDLQLLGIGRNGHIGFNEPGSAWGSETRLVDLEPETVRSNFSNPEKAPDQAITMGVKTIMNAQSLLLLASGAEKAGVLREALHGDVTPDVPASILQLHPDVTVVLDVDAAGELPDADSSGSSDM